MTLASGARIVVVEDNRPIRDMVRLILDDAGYDVVTADGGAAGIDTIKRLHPDLVLVDLDMPEVDGYDVLAAVRKDRKCCRACVLAFTAFSMSGDRQRIIAKGFDGYICKPIDPQAFVKEIAASGVHSRRSA